MCKKALVAGVAVVVSLLTAYYFCPTVRVWVNERHQEAQDSIPLEKKIAAAKLRLDELAQEDERHFHKVAVQIVDVQNLEKQVAAMRKKVSEDEVRLVAMKGSLDKAEKWVSYNGTKYEVEPFREELRANARRFQIDEQLLKSKEEQLALRKKNMEINRKNLAELKLKRQQMKTELERLETALASARQAEAEDKNTFDDASYLELAKEIDGIRTRMEVLKQERILKSEIDGPVRASEQRKEQDAAIDRFLNERFTDKQ